LTDGILAGLALDGLTLLPYGILAGLPLPWLPLSERLTRSENFGCRHETSG
jgi:hypothetical protein